MTEKQLQQAISKLPEGETFSRVYRAFEGGIRLISTERNGAEHRYRVVFDRDWNADIEPF